VRLYQVTCITLNFVLFKVGLVFYLFGYSSNERGFSVESRLKRISSKFLLWKRNDSSVVLYT